MNKKIAIIIPYFGSFPVWFDLFLYSCSKNPSLEFLFYTDCVIPKVVYENTRFIEISFKEYCLRASQALGINFSPSNAYKLCDLRPFYGIIHRQDLSEFEFWGYGDIDLIYGNLEIVISERRLKYYDLITTHDDRVAGHFTVIRKDSKFTMLCFKIKQYQEKLENERHMALDEDDFSYLAYPQLRMLERIYRYMVKPFGVWHKKFFKWVNPVFCNRITKRSFVEYFTTEIPKESDIWKYSLCDGKIEKLPIGLELPYLHFLFFKKTQYLVTEKFWKPNFYQIENLSDVISKGRELYIDLEGIKSLNE